MGVSGTKSVSLTSLMAELAELASKERKDASKDASEASLAELSASIKAADHEQLAAKQDYYYQNLDGTIGQIPFFGKGIVLIGTSGAQEQALTGLPGMFKPMARAAADENGESSENTLDDNSLLNHYAYADRADRDKNKDLAKRAEIDAKRAGKAAESAKSGVEDAKKAFEAIDKNMREILADTKRAHDKIMG